ncbi:ATP-binding protein [Streptomonospora litoralis]|uniref:Histidine kinase-, DNA gyrase B-, and HSP90-like ATPase n=1 Tax=Streptomonospora litoralis TaxID=2498135 RepID=A0A4P6Q7R2_9ACTN|nr:ATP-binding protein [Streptomonospora litoralis]QBI55481.1 Histidine kinase-, DNA gyrase B-, and HSP90-like ATPase [Streptomonospora litoralis]
MRSVLFGHEPEQVTRARSWCRRTSGVPYDRLYPVLLALSELYTNALTHTASGLPGGRVRIDLTVLADGIRLAVTDQGPRPGKPATHPTLPESDPLEEHGRGLVLVDRLSRDWGWHGVPGLPTTVWALFDRSPSFGR